uniref:Uncharacterized protein n=1 Tax=viral metagenome TaxID=1070528 RepID=A0A6C0B1A9_9ZZZZ
MERRINKRIDAYITELKDSIRDKATALEIPNEQLNSLLQYIYDYDRLSLTKEDFLKRKRVKNIVPFCDRCGAKRANGEQCTRRKKEEDEYCGTHMKGTPHGMVDLQEENKQTMQKIEVWAQDIQGIIYYIDKMMNVYQAEDIISNKTNPKIIAKYVKQGDVYTIPEFEI